MKNYERTRHGYFGYDHIMPVVTFGQGVGLDHPRSHHVP